MEYNLYLDDIRVPPSGTNFIVVRSYTDAVAFVEAHGMPAYISFDHDLATEKTGYDFAKWLGEKVVHEELQMFKWNIHSANPPGAENINKYLEFVKEYVKR